MNRTKNLLSVLGIILLLGLGWIAGEKIATSVRTNNVAASSVNSIISTPVDFFSQEFESSEDIVPVSGLATGGLGDALLKSNVWNSLLGYERKQNCTDLKSTAIEVDQINQAGEFWVEDWSVDACGKTEVFKIKFTPDQIGGTEYQIINNSLRNVN